MLVRFTSERQNVKESSRCKTTPDDEGRERDTKINRDLKQSTRKPYQQFRVPIKARRNSPEEIRSPFRERKFVSKQLNESVQMDKDVGGDSESRRKRWMVMCKRWRWGESRVSQRDKREIKRCKCVRRV